MYIVNDQKEVRMSELSEIESYTLNRVVFSIYYKSPSYYLCINKKPYAWMRQPMNKAELIRLAHNYKEMIDGLTGKAPEAKG